MMRARETNSLCLECGLCCNGVIFANGQLRAQDDSTRLRALGLRLVAKSKTGKFKQPCAALAGCKCTIYSERPDYCRQFECLLLKALKSNEVKPQEALRTIRSALKLVKAIKSLLQRLGDEDESEPLSKRFRRMERKLESGTPNKEAAYLFGELTLANHELNVLLSTRFYPAT